MSGRAPKLSVTEWILSASSTAEAIECVAGAGYGAIELSANPELDLRLVQDCLAANDLTVSSLCGMYSLERDYAHESLVRRRRAGEYLRTSLELAAELGAGAVVVVPTYRVEDPPIDREGELDRAASTIGSAAQGLVDGGPVIVLEALNRYETHLVRTLSEADELRSRIDSPYVRLMADVFHMNIEEDSITEPLLQHADQISHIHLADNQRREPGSGQLDFVALMETVGEMAYAGTLAMEFLPATQVALIAARQTLSRSQAGSSRLHSGYELS